MLRLGLLNVSVFKNQMHSWSSDSLESLHLGKRTHSTIDYILHSWSCDSLESLMPTYTIVDHKFYMRTHSTGTKCAARMPPPRSYRVLAPSRPLSLLSPALAPAPPSDPYSFLSLPHIQTYIHCASTCVCVRAHVRVCVYACVPVRVCAWTRVIFFLSRSPSLPLSLSLSLSFAVRLYMSGMRAWVRQNAICFY